MDMQEQINERDVLIVTAGAAGGHQNRVTGLVAAIRTLFDISPSPVLVFRRGDMSLIYGNQRLKELIGECEIGAIFIPESEKQALKKHMKQEGGVRHKMHIRVAGDSTLCVFLNTDSLIIDDTEVVFAYVERYENSKKDALSAARGTQVNSRPVRGGASRDALHSISNLMVVLTARMENLAKITDEQPASKIRELMVNAAHAETTQDFSLHADLLRTEIDSILASRSICGEWIIQISEGLNKISDVLHAQADYDYRTYATVTDIGAMLKSSIAGSIKELDDWGIEVLSAVEGNAEARLPRNVLIPVISSLIRNSGQVLFNHFTFKPSIKLSARYLNPGTLEIEIEDNGPGVPESQRARIFERGFTTNLNAQGLGLAFCKEALAEVGGRIVVDSPTEHMGAIFRVMIPVS